MLLKVSSVSKAADGDIILDDVSFSQKKFQKLAIAGETGSGKTTLLKIIAGLVQPDSGEVLFEEARLLGPDESLVAGDRRIAFLSQHFELPKFLRVEQVLEYANTLSDDDAQTLFEICEIGHLLKRTTADLSGGEAQRIALAKLLIASPKLLLLDEPFSHLDMVHKNILKAVVDAICEKLKITVTLVSHDPSDILPWADKILVLKDGRVIQKGTPEKIYREPANEYVAGLFGKYNLLNEFAVRVGPRRNGSAEIFLRPEAVKLSSKKLHSVKGKVSQIRFFGSYYEVEVVVEDNILTVKTENSKIKPGQSVYVLFPKNGARGNG
jgi:ABC-type sulfate/molybdate transport systems ATPase subunit